MSGQKKIYLTKKVLKDLFLFSLPIIFGQMGVMLISAGDMYVASAHSTLSVASIGVATGVFNPVFLFGIGLMMGISPSMAIKRGKGEDTHKYLKSAIVYSLLVGLALTIIMLIVNQFVPYFGIEKEMVKPVQRYIEIIAWSFPFGLVFQAIKEFLQSFEKVFMTNFIALVAVVVNLGFNYIFVFGMFGTTAFGYDGLAYASFAIRIFLAMVLLILTRKYLSWGKVDFNFIKSTFKFSLPIASMFFIEVLAFCVVSILIGGMGVATAAANNILLNVASITFMIPLSISNAVSVKIGARFGEKDLDGIKKYSYAAIFISTVFMIITASLYILFPEQIMKFVTQDPEVISIGVSLLFIVAMFQLVDGLQITLAGILRGMELTKESFIAVLTGYWLLGIPFGLVLAFKFGFDARGLWIGLATSLAMVAIALSFVFLKELKRLSTHSLPNHK
jgi:MATE family multidrug resistance protein